MPQQYIYQRGDTVYTFPNYTAAKRWLGLRNITKEQFAANYLNKVDSTGGMWTIEQSYLPLPATNTNLYNHTTLENPVWWEEWSIPINAAPIADPSVAARRAILRAQIYDRNMGIVAGIYKDVFEHRAELFDVPHAPITPYQPTGMAVDDGTNIVDTDLKSFCRDNNITLNYHVLQSILAGRWQHYTFVLSAAAKQALTEYCGYFEFCKTDPPQTPTTATSTFNPVEKYNRFGEIVECYPNPSVAAKANDLTPSALRRKLAGWDDSCRHQFRYALPQTDQTNLFPIEQWRDNTLINRFSTLEEAATTLECGKSTIDRWIHSGEIDHFGCTWRRAKA